MYQVKFFIRNFFGFNQRETNGFIVLSLILFGLLFIPSLISRYYPVEEVSTKNDQQKLSMILASLNHDTSAIRNEPAPSIRSFKSINPNTAALEDLKSLFGNKIATTILNFRSKGGRFKTKEELKKIYGMNEVLYNQIHSFIVIPGSYQKNSSNEFKSNIVAFDINNADTIQLESLKGIGKILASRIIKYRTKLGGFVSKAQYNEVYGLDSLVVLELEKRTFIAKDFQPRKISINNATIDLFYSHPYIGRKYSNVLVEYRKNHGAFSSLEELKSLVAIPEEAINKMRAYLSL